MSIAGKNLRMLLVQVSYLIAYVELSCDMKSVHNLAMGAAVGAPAKPKARAVTVTSHDVIEFLYCCKIVYNA